MDKTHSVARKIIIAIDGPAGSGKSTLASLLARKYNYTNIETGAMYRALALKALEAGLPLDDEGTLSDLARNSRIELQPRPEGCAVPVHSSRHVPLGVFFDIPIVHRQPVRLGGKQGVADTIGEASSGSPAWSWKAAISERKFFPMPRSRYFSMLLPKFAATAAFCKSR